MWPGNVRELENCLAQASLLASNGIITPEELPPRITGLAPAAGLEQHEREIIRRTLAQVQGNKKLAAERLGISRTTLYAKMKKYELSAS
jgi:two-component system response regulator HydG